MSEERDDRISRARKNPIYKTDFTKPLSEIVGGLRFELAHIRGQMSDIRYAFPGYMEPMRDVEGLITCGLVTLEYMREEMRKNERAQP